MSFNTDISKARFQNLWGGAYYEERQYISRGYPCCGSGMANVMIDPFASASGIALEIGPGAGFWSSRIISSFEHSFMVDVIEEPSTFRGSGDYTWIEAGDRDYSLSGVADASVDYVFSFDLFCHLSVIARLSYLLSIYRVMKPGAHGVIMFGDWGKTGNHERFSMNQSEKNRHLIIPHVHAFYDNLDRAVSLLEVVGFDVEYNMFPDAPDNILQFKK